MTHAQIVKSKNNLEGIDHIPAALAPDEVAEGLVSRSNSIESRSIYKKRTGLAPLECRV